MKLRAKPTNNYKINNHNNHYNNNHNNDNIKNNHDNNHYNKITEFWSKIQGLTQVSSF